MSGPDPGWSRSRGRRNGRRIRQLETNAFVAAPPAQASHSGATDGPDPGRSLPLPRRSARCRLRSTEETILTEIVAKALDSGATTVTIATAPSGPAVTILDDGAGIRRRELARYHDRQPAPPGRLDGHQLDSLMLSDYR